MSTTTTKRKRRALTAEEVRERQQARLDRALAIRSDPADPRHGRVYCFTYYRCRCERCSEANRAAVARWRATGSTK